MIVKAAVVGAGLMGTGIARHMASNNLEVTLLDKDKRQLAKAQKAAPGVACTTDFKALAAADYVIEAVFEDLIVKREVLAIISNHTSPGCIIATNTSSLLVGDLASAVKHPNYFIGVHYNNPADINPIVEIIASQQSDKSCIQTVYEWMKSANKHPIKCADTPCFILNRQSLPYINEATRCLTIATPGQIDHAAITEFGVGLGPFAVMNLVGLPVMAASSKNLSVLGRGYAPAAQLQEKATFRNPEWDIDEVTDMDVKLQQQIAHRLRGAMMFPGKDILDRGLCSRDDLHLICLQALGYATSSPELLENLENNTSSELITAYLANQ